MPNRRIISSADDKHRAKVWPADGIGQLWSSASRAFAILPLQPYGALVSLLVDGLGGAMIWRVVALSILAFMISGCATERSGADFAAMSQKVGPPKAGQARIVVFREKGFAGIVDEGWDVKLDGEPMSELKTGTYVYADRPAGRHQLSSTMALFPGVTQRDVSVASGRTYFFLARPSERAHALNAASAAGGLTGLVVGAAVTSGDSNPGPLEFFPMEEGAARAAITDLRLAQ